MRLTELNARWFRSADGVLVGVTFDCPHCKTTRIGVNTTSDGAQHMHDHQALELDAPEVHVAPGIGCLWHMSGNDFNDLSLTPSVDASASGHWHGFVTNGEVT